MKKNHFVKLLSLFLTFIFILGPEVLADEGALLTMVQNLQKQMGKMQETIQWQSEVIKELQERSKEIKGPQRSEDTLSFKENLKESIGDSDKWLKGLKFKGDFRLRYEATERTSGGGAATTSDEDRNRFRYRLRFGFEKEFNDELKAGFRVVSGGPGSITSTNQTLDTQFSHKAVAIDQAYATYTPAWAEVGPVQKLEITGGKFANPLSAGHTWIFWDSDVTPEGLYEKLNFKIIETDDLDIHGSVLAAQLILEEGESGSHQDAELFAYQWGLRGKLMKESLEYPLDLKSFVSLYQTRDYHVAGNFAAGNNFLDAAGNLAARDFNILSFYNEVGWKIDPLPSFKVFFETSKNLQNHGTLTTGQGQDHAWFLGAKLGKAKKKGTWELGYTYAWVESNALLGAFVDGDFGSTNNRGSVFKAAYSLTDYLKLVGSAFFTNGIETSDAAGLVDREQSLFQIDLVWKF